MTTATHPGFSAAMIRKEEWRRDDLVRFQTALVRRAIGLLDIDRVNYFGADDVPEDFQPLDKSTSGAAIGALRAAGVITRSYVCDTNATPKVTYGERPSKRDNCHGHRTKLWTLTSRAIAVEWLKRHGVNLDPIQPDLFAVSNLQSPISNPPQP